MPIIYTYPSATPTTEDLLVFSDVSATDPAKDTRKCTIGDLVSLVGALVPGGGTVTSVDVSGGTSGLVFTGGAITTTGTITITSGTLDETYGGTGNNSYAVGDILYASGATTLTRLPGAGAGTLILTSGGVGVAPSWAAPSTAGLVTTFNVDATTLPGLTPTGATSGAIVLSGTLGVIGGGTGLATLTSGYFLKGNGTSAVTLAQYADLTTDVTGILPVTNGGTGLATLTDGAILLGSGTGAVTMLGPATNGQILIGRTGLDPVFDTLTAGANITITNGAGTITIASTTGVPTKISYDNQLTFKGGTSGTYVPNVARLATYWTLGAFCYLEFYMEWNTAHGCVGTIIMDNLPKNIDPVGATTEQGSCLITVNTNMGTSSVNPAPLTGRPGVTGNNEIIFRNHTALGIIEDSIWTDLNPEPVGNYVLAGTATWLEATA